MATRAAGRSKYGAVRTEYDGTTYASKAEADYARDLDAKMRAGTVHNWLRCHLSIILVDGPTYADRITYTPDFLVIRERGSVAEYVEVKGKETTDWRLRLKLYKAFGPPNPLRIVYGDGREVVVTSRKEAALSPAAGGGDGAE